MLTLMFGLQLAILATVMVLAILFLRASIRPEDFPPGPLSLPVVGNLLSLDIRNLGRSFSVLKSQYGDIFSLHIGTTPVVVLNSLEIIKEAFEKESFCGRPSIFAGTFFQKGKSGICTTEGKDWASQRNFLKDHLETLLKPKENNNEGNEGNNTNSCRLEQLMLEEIQDLKSEFNHLRTHQAKPEQGLSVGHTFNVCIVNVLFAISKGERHHEQHPEFVSVYECIDKINEFMSRAAIFSFMPILAKIVPGSYSKIEKGRYHRNHFLTITKRWIKEHQDDFKGNRMEDLQDAYLAKIAEQTPNFTEDNLGAMVREMFVIGAETLSVLMRWSVRILSIEREVQKRVHEELDENLKRNEIVRWEHRHKLPFLRATISELQRVADITPTALPHKTTEESLIGLHLLPKGTNVIANISAVHRDPKLWIAPEEFRPEHFLDEDGNYNELKPGFLPYGIGPRRCPASAMAEMQTFLLLANFLHAFEVSTPAGDRRDIGTQYKVGTGFIRNPKPFKVILTPRDDNQSNSGGNSQGKKESNNEGNKEGNNEGNINEGNNNGNEGNSNNEGNNNEGNNNEGNNEGKNKSNNVGNNEGNKEP